MKSKTTIIDVSKWQGDIDWARVYASGCDKAIVRIGYRGYHYGDIVEDPYARKNLTEASETGVHLGVYFYSQAINEKEAIEEAEFCLKLLKETGVQIDFPIFIDLEYAQTSRSGRADKLDKETRTKAALAFIQRIEEAGYTSGIYCSTFFLRDELIADEFSPYWQWIADYREISEEYFLQCNPHADLWQYSSEKKINGIEVNVDFNKIISDIFVDYEENTEKQRILELITTIEDSLKKLKNILS